MPEVIICVSHESATPSSFFFRRTRIPLFDESIFIPLYIVRTVSERSLDSVLSNGLKGIKVDGYSVISNPQPPKHNDYPSSKPNYSQPRQYPGWYPVNYLSLTIRAVLTVSCRSGLPKKTQLYIFFQIADVTKFRQDLVRFIPLITTVAQVLKDRDAIEDHKKKKLPGLLTLVGVNISISHKGFVKVRKNESNNAE